MSDARLASPAAERNAVPIAEVLAGVLPARGSVVEIASGSGQHAAHFAGAFPGLTWQPTDREPRHRASIAAWREQAALPNLLAPLELDVMHPWPVSRADAMLCINMIHISPWRATLALFAGAAKVLPEGAPLFLYGPYRRREVPTAPSNEAFDADLRARDPSWGLRDLDEVTAVARDAGFDRMHVVAMPANNLSVIFRRRAA